jgi:nitrogen fixation protein NifU and related proteins
MDRQEQIEILLDHYENPRHRHRLDPNDVEMPGGNPGCGDVITIFLNVDESGQQIVDVSFEGEGCTISQAGASILLEMIHDEGWSIEDVVGLDYQVMMDILGTDVVKTRPKCATLALGTLKAAIKKYQRDKLKAEAGLLDDLDAINEEFGIVTGDSASRNEE